LMGAEVCTSTAKQGHRPSNVRIIQNQTLTTPLTTDGFVPDRDIPLDIERRASIGVVTESRL